MTVASLVLNTDHPLVLSFGNAIGISYPLPLDFLPWFPTFTWMTTPKLYVNVVLSSHQCQFKISFELKNKIEIFSFISIQTFWFRFSFGLILFQIIKRMVLVQFYR